MAIVTYEVVQPPTSAELQQQARDSISDERPTTRGLLDLVVRAIQDVPAPTDETLQVRMRSPELDHSGNIVRILGAGVLNANTEERFDSPSVAITLAPDSSQPALANIVRV